MASTAAYIPNGNMLAMGEKHYHLSKVMSKLPQNRKRVLRFGAHCVSQFYLHGPLICHWFLMTEHGEVCGVLCS
jgi:hypothetical protein